MTGVHSADHRDHGSSRTIVRTDDLVKLVTREFKQNPYPALERIREDRAATPIDISGLRTWIVARFEDACRLLTDANLSKDFEARQKEILSRSVIRPEKLRGIPRVLRRHMLDSDGPDHARLRGVVSGYFTPHVVQSLGPGIRRTADELLATLPDHEPVDLIDRFCRPLARSVIADVVGISRGDPAPFARWVNDLLTAPDQKYLKRSATEFAEFITALLARKAVEPGADLATALVGAVGRGDLAEHEAIATVQILLTGGLEPLNGIANAVYALLTNPDQLALLTEEQSLLSKCVNEVLRYESPFRMLTPRYATAPVELGDVTIPEHEMILVSAAAAGRDPARFEHPDAFDITRDARAHLGFGRGLHRCLGVHLGRLEIETALAALVSRAPAIRLAVALEDLDWQPGIFMRRLATLPVVFG